MDFPLYNFRPQECLSMAEDANEDDGAYSLVAVIEHSGSTNAGHYVTYCRSLYAPQWYAFDDSSVYKVRPASPGQAVPWGRKGGILSMEPPFPLSGPFWYCFAARLAA